MCVIDSLNTMTYNVKGVTHSTMTNEMREALCEYSKDPTCTQK